RQCAPSSLFLCLLFGNARGVGAADLFARGWSAPGFRARDAKLDDVFLRVVASVLVFVGVHLSLLRLRHGKSHDMDSVGGEIKNFQIIFAEFSENYPKNFRDYLKIISWHALCQAQS